MEDFTNVSALAQYGAVGVALASIAANVFIVKLFVGAIKGFYAEMARLNATLSDLSAEVKSFSHIRHRKREKQPIS